MRRHLTLSAAVLLALVAAPPARAAFGPVEPVSASPADGARAATTPTGTSLLVWKRNDGANDRVEARYRSLGGTYGPVMTLSPAGLNGEEPAVDVDDQGNAVVAWDAEPATGHIRVQGRVVFATGALGPVRDLTDGHTDAFGPQVGMGASGPALVAWTFHDTTPTEDELRIQGTTMTLGSSVAPRQTLSPSQQISNEPVVAVDPDGAGLVGWHWGRPGIDDLIDVRAWRHGAGFGTVQQLTHPFLRNEHPSVAVNGAGEGFVAWKHFNSNGTLTVQGMADNVFGAAGPLVKISGPETLDNGPPATAIDDSGTALVAWDRQATPDALQLRARTVTGTATLGPLKDVSAEVGVPGRTTLNGRLAMTPAGFGIAVWDQFDTDVGQLQIHARVRRADGDWATAQRIPTAGSSERPWVTLDAAGDALAAWPGSDDGGIVEAAARPH